MQNASLHCDLCNFLSILIGFLSLLVATLTYISARQILKNMRIFKKKPDYLDWKELETEISLSIKEIKEDKSTGKPFFDKYLHLRNSVIKNILMNDSFRSMFKKEQIEKLTDLKMKNVFMNRDLIWPKTKP